MTTPSMNNNHKPKQLHSITKHPIPPTIELSCVSHALRDLKWKSAISDELTALMRQHMGISSPTTSLQTSGLQMGIQGEKKF